MSKKESILPGNYYHIYNHSNGNLNIFRTEENYRFFIERFVKYMSPYADTYAYCLMPSHFHFLIRVREFREILVSEKVEKQNLVLERSDLFKRSDLSIEKEEILPKQVTNSIKNWLISYTQSYHKVFNTKGNLFQQRIKRQKVNDETRLLNLISFIHLNPIIHGFTTDINEWKYNSLMYYIKPQSSFLSTKEGLELYGDLENFLNYHQDKMLFNILENLESDFL